MQSGCVVSRPTKSHNPICRGLCGWRRDKSCLLDGGGRRELFRGTRRPNPASSIASGTYGPPPTHKDGGGRRDLFFGWRCEVLPSDETPRMRRARARAIRGVSVWWDPCLRVIRDSTLDWGGCFAQQQIDARGLACGRDRLGEMEGAARAGENGGVCTVVEVRRKGAGRDSIFQNVLSSQPEPGPCRPEVVKGG